MEIKEVSLSESKHINVDQKYEIQFEQAATKGVLGFKVTAHADDLEICKADATELLGHALRRAALVYPTPSTSPIMEINGK